jgi:hypothetical protein
LCVLSVFSCGGCDRYLVEMLLLLYLYVFIGICIILCGESGTEVRFDWDQLCAYSVGYLCYAEFFCLLGQLSLGVEGG